MSEFDAIRAGVIAAGMRAQEIADRVRADMSRSGWPYANVTYSPRARRQMRGYRIPLREIRRRP